MFKKFSFKNPISLKWKWGFFLFLGFYLIGFIGLVFYHQHFVQNQRVAATSFYREDFKSAVDYLGFFSNLFEDETASGEANQLSNQVYEFAEANTSEEIIFRLYNGNNQLIYSSKNVQENSVDAHEPKESLKSVDGILSWVASSPIYSKENGKITGTFQYIAQSKIFTDTEIRQEKIFLQALLILFFVSMLLAWLVSIIFLRPLTYLNNALDMIEEESLSEIRMRKPRSTDEWSDLTIHINHLLDKIDLYVRNQKQFVEDVSHELRTPVAIVEGHLTMLNRWGKNDPEILEESISASLQEISRMKGLVQEMLDLMRADHAEIDYKDEVTEVNSTIQQVYNNFVMLHPDFTFHLDSDKNMDDVYVRIFRNHFEQILIILLDNAVKYSLERKEIHISVATTLSEVEIAVQDFGEGMTEEDKKRVFGRFYRVDKARSRDKGGNGLGLSIAQQLVQSYKGNIRVESVLGHGSIFYINFPILTDNRVIYQYKQREIEKNFNY